MLGLEIQSDLKIICRLPVVVTTRPTQVRPHVNEYECLYQDYILMSNTLALIDNRWHIFSLNME